MSGGEEARGSAASPEGFAQASIPREPFHAPLILRASSRRRADRLRDAGLTAVLWCGWAYLLAASVGALWVPPFVHRLLPVQPPEEPGQLLGVVIICALIAFAIMGGMLGRALTDRKRFAGQDRRRAAPEPTEAELVALLGVETLDLPVLRAARRMVLHHGPDGRIVRAETGWDVPPGGTGTG